MAEEKVLYRESVDLNVPKEAGGSGIEIIELIYHNEENYLEIPYTYEDILSKINNHPVLLRLSEASGDYPYQFIIFITQIAGRNLYTVYLNCDVATASSLVQTYVFAENTNLGPNLYHVINVNPDDPIG